MEIIIASDQELPQAAKQFLAWLGDAKKVAFTGEIGAGKTSLIKAICKQLGVEDAITSPTFSLVNEYLLPGISDQAAQRIHHLDLYRLNSLQAALDIGIEDYLEDEHYCFIEWPELIEDLLPPTFHKINIQIIDNSSRKILFL